MKTLGKLLIVTHGGAAPLGPVKELIGSLLYHPDEPGRKFGKIWFITLTGKPWKALLKLNKEMSTYAPERISLSGAIRYPADTIIYYGMSEKDETEVVALTKRGTHIHRLALPEKKLVDKALQVSKSQEPTWRDSSGFLWKIKKMSSSHLRGAIRALDRLLPMGERYLSFLRMFGEDGAEHIEYHDKVLARAMQSRSELLDELRRRNQPLYQDELTF